VVSAVFALMGAEILLNINLNGSMPVVLRAFSISVFLLVFGVASTILCTAKADSMARSFGFLVLWTGRGVFFLTMGLMLFPEVCPGSWSRNCLENKRLVTQLGVVAAGTSVVLGLVICVLRCTTISESLSLDVLGHAKSILPLDLAALVASAGMVVLGVDILLGIDVNAPAANLCSNISALFIVLAFAVASLLASFRTTPFVVALFGFLAHGFQRGVFYLLMGFYTVGFTYRSKGNTMEYVTSGCSILSIVIGIVMIVLGCL